MAELAPEDQQVGDSTGGSNGVHQSSYVAVHENEGRRGNAKAELNEEYQKKMQEDKEWVDIKRTVESLVREINALLPENSKLRSKKKLAKMHDWGLVTKPTLTSIINHATKSAKERIEQAQHKENGKEATDGKKIIQAAQAELENLESLSTTLNTVYKEREKVHRRVEKRYSTEQQQATQTAAADAAKKVSVEVYERAARIVSASSNVITSLQDIRHGQDTDASQPEDKIGFDLAYPEDLFDDPDSQDPEERGFERASTMFRKGKTRTQVLSDRKCEDIFVDDTEPVPIELPQDTPANIGIPVEQTADVRRLFALALFGPVDARKKEREQELKGGFECRRCKDFVDPEYASQGLWPNMSQLRQHERNFHTPWRDRFLFLRKETTRDGHVVWRCPCVGCPASEEEFQSLKELNEHMVNGVCIEREMWILLASHDRVDDAGKSRELLKQLEEMVRTGSGPQTRLARGLSAIDISEGLKNVDTADKSANQLVADRDLVVKDLSQGREPAPRSAWSTILDLTLQSVLPSQEVKNGDDGVVGAQLLRILQDMRVSEAERETHLSDIEDCKNILDSAIQMRQATAQTQTEAQAILGKIQDEKAKLAGPHS